MAALTYHVVLMMDVTRRGRRRVKETPDWRLVTCPAPPSAPCVSLQAHALKPANHPVMHIRMSRFQDRYLALQGANKAFATFVSDRSLSNAANKDLIKRQRARCTWLSTCLSPNIKKLSHWCRLPELASEEMQLAVATYQLDAPELLEQGAA